MNRHRYSRRLLFISTSSILLIAALIAFFITKNPNKPSQTKEDKIDDRSAFLGNEEVETEGTIAPTQTITITPTHSVTNTPLATVTITAKPTVTPTQRIEAPTTRADMMRNIICTEWKERCETGLSLATSRNFGLSPNSTVYPNKVGLFLVPCSATIIKEVYPMVENETAAEFTTRCKQDLMDPAKNSKVAYDYYVQFGNFAILTKW